MSGCRYFFSTCISLWNRKLLGKGHGVLGKGPFPGDSSIIAAEGYNVFSTQRKAIRVSKTNRKHPVLQLLCL